MAERTIEHVFQCTPETYWSRVFFSTDFNRRLFVERLHFERWELVSREEREEGHHQVLEAIPSVRNLPGPLKSLLKKGTGYREEGTFSRSRSRYDYRAISHSLPDKLLVTGHVEVKPEGDGACRRIYRTEVRAKIFGVGGMLEERVLGDLFKSLEKAAALTREWIETHQLSDAR